MSTQAPIKERGWPAYAHEVRAILDDRQSQFRRALSYQPNPEFTDFAGPEMYAPTKIDRKGEEYPGEEVFGIYCKDGEWGLPCPYGKPGDRLWVRETWALNTGCQYDHSSRVHYKDRETKLVHWMDGHGIGEKYGLSLEWEDRWRPSIHMPRWASRINLEVTSVRVERVQDISADDAELEGIDMIDYEDRGEVLQRYHCGEFGGDHPVDVFRDLWDSINGKKHPWDSNPWVWCVAFRRIEK